MTIGLAKRRLTVEQFNRMIDAGIFPEHDRLELIEGDIVEMAPIGARHASCVDRVVDVCRTFPMELAIVRVQSPVELTPVTRVEPDLTLLRRRPDFYAERMPQPSDILLIVEVADTSLESDRAVKIPMYARAGIPEVWLVDLTTDCIEVYREPTPDGYRGLRRAGPGDQVSLLAFPGVTFPATRIVGPIA